MRLLVVEDERKVANALREGLEGEGYEVVIEETGEDALTRSTTERFDLVLLDLGLPGRDGLEIVTDLRDEGVNTPVLILTARDTVDDRVKGLNGGAGRLPGEAVRVLGAAGTYPGHLSTRPPDV